MTTAQLQQAWSQAVSLYQHKQYDAALSLCKQLATAQHAPQVRLLLAQCYRKTGQTQQALRVYQQLLKSAPNNPDVLCGQAGAYADKGDTSKARQCYTRALRVNPKHYDTNFNFARLLNADGEASQAAEYYGRAANLTQQPVAALVAQAQCWLQCREHKKAVSQLLALQQEQPANYTVNVTLATAYKTCSDFASAQALLTKLHAADPSDLRVSQLLADVAFEAGDYHTAEHQYKHLLTVNPLNSKAVQGLAQTRWMLCDSNWKAVYESALATAPDDRAILTVYGLHLIKAEQLDEAYQLLCPLADTILSHPPLSAMLGLLERERGDIAGSCQRLKRAVKSHPDVNELQKELAITLMCNNQPNDAGKIIKGLMRKEPWNKGWIAHQSALDKLQKNVTSYARLHDYHEFVFANPITTPAGFKNNAAFNAALAADLNQLHQRLHAPPVEQSLRTGTQTFGNLFDQNIATVQALKQAISEQVSRYIGQLPRIPGHPLCGEKTNQFDYSGSWSVRLAGTGYHRNHYHHEGWISACYYVSLPEALTHDGQGWIKFGQPDISSQLIFEPDFVLKPQAGHVVLFPSYMWHGTVPFESDENRLTVAFDIVPT
ncbi:tetratricopeptide repeat protein [Alteromonas sp. ASW11-19]|uniref:Tetratricopeptide repeat protein n=1 Tax=Alteromonas salexigens TaxID=2982530 RepID=A0ABT2VPU2_9ALTE|nr:tetratricopeptide repeat protein [Alteromonas salexigens]MCU7555084.1 tetratricopeptide repeat protein [Alteromonas salexigens]